MPVGSAVIAQGLWYGRLCSVSSSTIIAYDHLITFEDEVRLIWRSRWSAGKVLFLISRYYNVFTIIFNSIFLYSPTITERFVWLRWQAVSGIFTYGVTEIILMLRLYAMYSASRVVLWLMAGGFALMLAAELAIVGFSTHAQIRAVDAAPNTVLPMDLCVLTDTWPRSNLYWVPFLVFETLLFALALARGMRSLRENELGLRPRGLKQGLSRLGGDMGCRSSRAMKAMEVLIRDSVLYFLLTLAIYLANFLAWTIDDGRIGEIPVTLAVALSTVMGQRLLLNIRANFEARQAPSPNAGADDAGDTYTFQLSTIAFDGVPVLPSSAGSTTAAGSTYSPCRYSTGHQAEAGPSSPLSPASLMSHTTLMTPVSPTSPAKFGSYVPHVHHDQ
ncbi:hypothetical protein DFH11DRAFT_1502867 [Phellopilus nigrolimitatus]|nr:hypothetical protein DFH11DRAFT_1502867 [Phellopilus nigrolimitatus]